MLANLCWNFGLTTFGSVSIVYAIFFSVEHFECIETPWRKKETKMTGIALLNEAKHFNGILRARTISRRKWIKLKLKLKIENYNWQIDSSHCSHLIASYSEVNTRFNEGEKHHRIVKLLTLFIWYTMPMFMTFCECEFAVYIKFIVD